MPPKKRRAGTEGQQNSKVEKYKYIENYNLLISISDDISKNIEYLYDNNTWNLKEMFNSLKEYYEEIDLNMKGIAWMNNIQYLDIPQNHKIDYANISLKAFINGDYKGMHTDTPNNTETESVYGKRIIFWTKTFSDFNQYKDSDNLDWIVKENRKIMFQILKYNNEQGNALSTIQKDFKTLTRIIKLLLGPEHELTYKYGALQIAFKDIYDMTDDDNLIRTDRELRSFVQYEQLLDILEAMEKKYKEMVLSLPVEDRKNGNKHTDKIFHVHQMILALSLYVYTFPSRHENLDLEIIKNVEDAKQGKNYIIINYNGPCTIIYNQIVKTHKPHKYTLASKQLQSFNNKLNTLLRNSLKLYPRDYLFIPKDCWPCKKLVKVSHSTVSVWLKDLLEEKNINIAGLRSSFVSYWFDKWNNRQKTICAKHMRTSVEELMRAYLKKYNNPDELARIKIDPDITLLTNVNAGVNKETGLLIDDNTNENVIERNTNIERAKSIVVHIHKDERKGDDGLNRLQRYLADPEKKTKHYEKIKEYSRDSKNIAKRYVRELNCKKLDFEKIKESTKTKYKLNIDDNGIYYSDLV
jgi:hypothetical protein